MLGHQEERTVAFRQRFEVVARSFFETIDHPEAGELTYAGPPFRMTETPPVIERAPTLGEHSGEFGASDDA